MSGPSKAELRRIADELHRLAHSGCPSLAGRELDELRTLVLDAATAEHERRDQLNQQRRTEAAAAEPGPEGHRFYEPADMPNSKMCATCSTVICGTTGAKYGVPACGEPCTDGSRRHYVVYDLDTPVGQRQNKCLHCKTVYTAEAATQF